MHNLYRNCGKLWFLQEMQMKFHVEKNKGNITNCCQNRVIHCLEQPLDTDEQRPFLEPLSIMIWLWRQQSLHNLSSMSWISFQMDQPGTSHLTAWRRGSR